MRCCLIMVISLLYGMGPILSCSSCSCFVLSLFRLLLYVCSGSSESDAVVVVVAGDVVVDDEADDVVVVVAGSDDNGWSPAVVAYSVCVCSENDVDRLK